MNARGSGADGNSDGSVNAADYVGWRKNVATGTPAAASSFASVSAVQLPAAPVLGSPSEFKQAGNVDVVTALEAFPLFPAFEASLVAQVSKWNDPTFNTRLEPLPKFNRIAEPRVKAIPLSSERTVHSTNSLLLLRAREIGFETLRQQGLREGTVSTSSEPPENSEVSLADNSSNERSQQLISLDTAFALLKELRA